MTSWNFADVWETIAARAPTRPALVQGERVVRWGDFDRHANALGRAFLAAGMGHQAKVAAYLYNGPEYLETYFAAFKVGMAPVNTNYRYGADELFYLFDNADAEAVVFHASFAPVLEAIRHRLTKVKLWIAAPDAGHAIPDWALDYDKLVEQAGPRATAPWGRSGDDLLLLYTGGTTGMPKGVMWRQDDLFNVLGAGGNATLGIEPLQDLAEAGTRIIDPLEPSPFRQLVACPLMHGTGQFSAFITLNMGGSVASLPSRKFDPAELWSEVERLKASTVVIVGPAFASPMLDCLNANPGRWDLSSVNLISSSGAVWSQENKHGLLAHMPGAMLYDSLGSSEAVGLGGSTSAAGAEVQTARFVLGPTVGVFTEDGQRVAPGSGERGLVAVTGFIPTGYYKDPEKSAKTFRVFEGVRWSVPGDFAEVEADGELKLLGRGSQVINTGGEKVFPEEVEEAIKKFAGVSDAVVVGVPDARFGERICAVVDVKPGHTAPSLADLATHVRAHLADYKAPRDLVLAPIIRAANGKVDVKAIRQQALEALGLS
jgi:fatty-acyl-CoA synthase